MTRSCENCGGVATVYAMDTCAGGWGGRYCDGHIPTGFQVTDQLTETAVRDVFQIDQDRMMTQAADAEMGDY